MSYRVRRKITSTTFRVDKQLCKLFLEPDFQHKPGFWIWNVGFAIGKSNRQLNDWYKNRRNKRGLAITKHLVGKSGMKAIVAAFKHLEIMRWHLPPGDALVLDCTSADPERQFKAWSRWHKKHPDVLIDYTHKKFYWFRPPYPSDTIHQLFRVIRRTPPDMKMSWDGPGYLLAFDTLPKDRSKPRPTEQTDLQESQVLQDL